MRQQEQRDRDGGRDEALKKKNLVKEMIINNGSTELKAIH